MGLALIEGWLRGLAPLSIVDEASIAVVREALRQEGAAIGFGGPALESLVTAASELGHKVKVYTNDMIDWLSSRTYNEPVAWAKVIVDERTDRILGAHLVGHAGEELIHLFAFAIRFGITASQIRDTVYAYPTYSADVKSML